MKIRWRNWEVDEKWQETELVNLIAQLKNPKDTLEIRLPCTHDKCFIKYGIRACQCCGDEFEVITYKD